jgi:GT2 family glycosyltransferase
MAVRRDVVLALGGFDERLGPGAPLDSGEDRDLAVRALAKGWWVAQTPHAYVEHNGFRTWDEGRELARRDWFGIGAAYAKPLKCRRPEIILALAYEVLYLGLVKPVAQRLVGRRRHSGVRQFRFFFVGLVRGMRTPVDRHMMLYV